MTTNSDYAALILRVSSGALFIAHGLLKVLVFTLPGTVAYFESLGLPGFLAYLTIAAELAGGVALILGVATRLVALALIPVLLGALWISGKIEAHHIFSKQALKIAQETADASMAAVSAAETWLAREIDLSEIEVQNAIWSRLEHQFRLLVWGVQVDRTNPDHLRMQTDARGLWLFARRKNEEAKVKVEVQEWYYPERMPEWLRGLRGIDLEAGSAPRS